MNASTLSDTPPIRTAPIALWRVAEAFMHWLHSLFGAPEDVARQHTLRRDEHNLMRAWIAAAEAILRHLLLIEAAACAPASPSRQRAPRQRQRQLIAFSPDAPEKWRVSFRSFTTTDRRRLPAEASAKVGPAGMRCSDFHRPGQVEKPGCRPEAGGPRRFHSAWPLAERYEALIRVFNDPGPYARRLAARLRAAPKRAQELLQFPAGASDKISFNNLCALREAAQCACPAPDTT